MAKKNKFITTEDDEYADVVEEDDSYEEDSLYNDNSDKKPKLFFIIGVVIFIFILLIILVSCRGGSKSSNNYLKDISVTQGVFNPEFNKEQSDYSVTVEDRDIVTIGCVLEDKKARATGCNTRVSLSDDCKDHVITVKAQNGKERTYTLNICRENLNAPTIDSVTIKPEGTTKGSVKVTVKASAKEGRKIHPTQGYSFDGGSTWQKSNTYTVKENTTLSIMVMDNESNLSKIYTQEIANIDKSSLSVKITGSTPSGTATESSVVLTSKITDSKGSESYNYVWYKDGKIISGANDEEYTATSAGKYKLVIETDEGAKATSNTWVVKRPGGGGGGGNTALVTITNIKSNPSSYTSSSVTLSVTASAKNGLHNKAYSFDGGKTWGAANYKSFTSNQKVSIVVRDVKGNKSSVSTYTINKIDKTKPTVTISGNGLVNNALTAVPNPKTTTSGYKYQWYNNDAAISGATNSTYTPKKSGNYSVKVITGANISAVSGKKYVSEVNPGSITITSSVKNGATVEGSVKLSTKVTNGTATAYQWYKDNKAISEANSSEYTVKATGTYIVYAYINGTLTRSSNAYQITVKKVPDALSITIDARTGSYNGTEYNGDWTNKTVYITVKAKGPKEIYDLQFNHDGSSSWYSHPTRAWRSLDINGNEATATVYFDGDINHEFKVRVIDVNDNKLTNSITVKVDKTPPYTPIVSNSAGCFTNIKTTESGNSIEIDMSNATETTSKKLKSVIICNYTTGSKVTVLDEGSGVASYADIRQPNPNGNFALYKTWNRITSSTSLGWTTKKGNTTYYQFGYRIYDKVGNVSNMLIGYGVKD